MKAIFLTVTVIISINNLIYSQLTGIYTLNESVGGTECNIYFYESDSYYIELSENVTSDIIESFVLSYGCYSSKKNEVIMTDKVHGYKMQLTPNKNQLKVKHAFNWLVNKEFSFYDNIYNNEPTFISSKTNASTARHERMNYENENKALFPLNMGVYETEQGFSLVLDSNNKYKLGIKNTIISEGTWNRERNELILFDTTLKHSFYALIGKDNLISKFLPGDDKGCRLYKK